MNASVGTRRYTHQNYRLMGGQRARNVCGILQIRNFPAADRIQYLNHAKNARNDPMEEGMSTGKSHPQSPWWTPLSPVALNWYPKLTPKPEVHTR